ncbi:glyoxalase [Nocardia cyriacigeorgica]|uniref:Glyoxalase-like domain n=1 Tax=Nocardia cyriacigeorgica TaxID=135487 RepID=A0A4U8VXG4_9NOCA|nr:glyoxalase [Nocardia cyriacigeorgica]VFA98231.1 Glyoxalase-like domain [Nocardia cyriacigeorgica]
MDDTAVPILLTSDLTRTMEFYRALGYTVTHEQTRPYLYGAIEANGCALHFISKPRDADLPAESMGCLVMVDDVAGRHKEFTAGLRAHFGKVPAKGRPRITRFRPGQSRFTLVDPDGNSIIYIQYDEPMKLEYGGSERLSGLAKVLDNARILRDSKNDDKAAARVLEVGIGRYRAVAPAVDVARAWAALTEIAVAAGDEQRASSYRDEMRAVPLTEDERTAIAGDANASEALRDWLGERQ